MHVHVYDDMTILRKLYKAAERQKTSGREEHTRTNKYQTILLSLHTLCSHNAQHNQGGILQKSHGRKCIIYYKSTEDQTFLMLRLLYLCAFGLAKLDWNLWYYMAEKSISNFINEIHTGWITGVTKEGKHLLHVCTSSSIPWKTWIFGVNDRCFSKLIVHIPNHE